MAAPNLFAFATSELSQDAFICWLASWADPSCRSLDAPMHETASANTKQESSYIPSATVRS